MKAVTRFDSCGVSHLDINGSNVMLAPPDKPTRMVIIDFGCMVIRQKGETNKEWANSVKADVSHLRISLEQKLEIKLNIEQRWHPLYPSQLSEMQSIYVASFPSVFLHT